MEVYDSGVVLQNYFRPAASAIALLSRYDRSGHAQKPPTLLNMRQPRQLVIHAAVS